MLKDAVDIEEDEKDDICIQHVKERKLKTPHPAPAVTRRKCNAAPAVTRRKCSARNFVEKLHDLLSCGPKPETLKYVVFILVCLGGMCANRKWKINKALLRVMVVAASFKFYIILLLQLNQ